MIAHQRTTQRVIDPHAMCLQDFLKTRPDGRIVTKIGEWLPHRFGRGGNDLAIWCDEICAGDIRGGLLIIEQERPGAARMLERVCAL
ncbi:hypothetical protein [Acidithiobacillus ferrooxidans]|uniref:hypothetical protein n=1 Tax=Acidithiobacillus ferrooxidans TaxID=920 RepID=UPI001C077EB8|nr:hypothetical protein [Acidithiobacillus ferrooxidans]